jgi:hypothetical protein
MVAAIGSRAQVMHGTAHHTEGGLIKKDLKLHPKSGEIVSRHKSKIEKKNPWIQAVQKAKRALKIKKKEFVLVSKGSPLYEKAKEIYMK